MGIRPRNGRSLDCPEGLIVYLSLFRRGIAGRWRSGHGVAGKFALAESGCAGVSARIPARHRASAKIGDCHNRRLGTLLAVLAAPSARAVPIFSHQRPELGNRGMSARMPTRQAGMPAPRVQSGESRRGLHFKVRDKTVPQMAAPVRMAGSLPHRRSGFMCVGRAEVDRAIRCVDRDTS